MLPVWGAYRVDACRIIDEMASHACTLGYSLLKCSLIQLFGCLGLDSSRGRGLSRWPHFERPTRIYMQRNDRQSGRVHTVVTLAAVQPPFPIKGHLTLWSLVLRSVVDRPLELVPRGNDWPLKRYVRYHR